MNIRGVQSGGVGPGFEDGLIEDAVLDGCVQSLDTPIECTFGGTGHHIAAYDARGVVAVVEKNASKRQDGISDTLKQCFTGFGTRQVRVFVASDHVRIVA